MFRLALLTLDIERYCCQTYPKVLHGSIVRHSRLVCHSFHGLLVVFGSLGYHVLLCATLRVRYLLVKLDGIGVKQCFC